MPILAPARIQTPTELARSLAHDERSWRPLVRFDRAERVAVRLPPTRPALDPAPGHGGWEAWLLTWLPGQGTGLHDHGGAAGAFVVLRGSLQETTLAPAGPGRFRLVSTQLDSPSVRAFGRRHLHDVANLGELPAVSLHVYAPALSTMTRYRLDDRGRLDVLSHERAGADW